MQALVVGVSLLVAGGCERDGRFELLAVQGLSSERLDAGRRVHLEGSGFPVGREVEVLLEGRMHGPLRRRWHVRHALGGRTVTPERVEITVTDEDVARLGGRGTFEGALELVVHGASLDGLAAQVVGRLENVRLDVVPSERHEHTPDGMALAEILGIEVGRARASHDDGDAAATILGLDEDDAEGDTLELAAAPGSSGVPITAVRTDRLALGPRGLRAGARIVSLDGLRVLDADELRVDPEARSTVLVLAPEHGAPIELVVDLDAALGRRPAASHRYDQLAAIVLVATLLFGAWPVGSRELVARAPAPREHKPYAPLVTGLLALAVAMVASVRAPADVSTLGWWLGLVLFFRVAAALGAGADEGVPPSEARRTLAAIAAGGLATAVSIGAFIAADGGGLGAARSLIPLEWPLVRSAFGPLALLGLVLAAAAVPRGLSCPTTRAHRLLRGVDDLGLALAACAFVDVAAVDAASTDPATRVAALSSSALLFAALLRARAASARVGPLVRALTTLFVALATVGVAAYWIGLAPGPTTERAVAEVVLVAIGLVIARVAALRAGPPPGARHAAAEGAFSPRAAR
ncbi:MAG: hypothetical protein OHK0013_19060 [Sandaracinaceae bacterium]